MDTIAKLSIVEQGINFDDMAIDTIVHAGKRQSEAFVESRMEYIASGFKDGDLIAMVDEYTTITIAKHCTNHYFLIATKHADYITTLSYVDFIAKGV